MTYNPANHSNWQLKRIANELQGVSDRLFTVFGSCSCRLPSSLQRAVNQQEKTQWILLRAVAIVKPRLDADAEE